MRQLLLMFFTILAAGAFFTFGDANAAPQVLANDTMASISGERGIAVLGIKKAPPEARFFQVYGERDTEVNREILLRNNFTDYPIDSADRVLEHYHTLQAGQASGKTVNDLIDEATPGRLPQFFIDEADRITKP